MKAHTRKSIRLCLVLGAALAAPAANAELTANAAVTSNYVWRGLTQTDDGAALQGGVDYAHDSGLYAGAWASNVDEGLEYDLYAGFANEVGDQFGYDLAYLTYSYTDEDFWPDTISEIKFGVSYGPASLNYYKGDDGTNDYTYVELGAELELPEDFSLALHYGVTSGDAVEAVDPDDDSKADYSIGVSKDFSGFNVTLSVADHEDDDAIVFLTVKKDFEL